MRLRSEALTVGSVGAASTRPSKRRGIVGSAGVAERGKGTGWIVWEPGRSRSRPRASAPADRVAGGTMARARKSPPTYAERKLRNTKRGGSRGPRKRSKLVTGYAWRKVVAPQ